MPILLYLLGIFLFVRAIYFKKTTGPMGILVGKSDKAYLGYGIVHLLVMVYIGGLIHSAIYGTRLGNLPLIGLGIIVVFMLSWYLISWLNHRKK